MGDVYSYWRSALKGAPDRSLMINTGPGADDSPQPGLYKVAATRGGPKVPLVIMVAMQNTNAIVHDVPAFDHQHHKIVATLNGDPIDNPAHYFPWAHPVAKSDLAYWNEHKYWPGELPALGHNSGAVDLSLLEQLDEAIGLADDYIAKTTIADQVTADMASNHVARVRQLKAALDKERDAKVRPHLEAQRAINAEYKPHIERADGVIAMINQRLTVYLKEEQRKREAAALAMAMAENQRRQDEYERKLAEAEKAQQALANDATADGAATPALPAAVAMPEAPRAVIPEPVRVLAGGQRGRRTGLKTIIDYVCDDYDATLAFLARHPDVQDAVLKIAKKQMRAGIAVPGMRRTENEVAS